MRDIRWPAFVTNRIAYAFATLSFGSGPHDLSVADCIPARNQDFDTYRLPEDDKLEPTPVGGDTFADMVQAGPL